MSLEDAGMTTTAPESEHPILAYIKALPEDEMILMARYFTNKHEMSGQPSYTVGQAKTIGRHVVAMGLCEAEIEQTDDERIEMWASYGLKVSVPEGRCKFSDSLMLAEYDGVPYCVDEHSKLVRQGKDHGIHRSISHRQMMIDCYHEKIKSVYNYCLSLDRGPVWVLTGGGAQVQAFFGYDQGYFAILYLDMHDAPRNTEAERDKLSKRKHSLVPQFEKHEPLFERLKLPGVKISFFGRSPSP